MQTDTRDAELWLIRPLLDAGLDLDEIRGLVDLLVLEAAVPASGGTPVCLTRLLDDRPSHVRTAWAEVIGRLLEVGARPVSRRDRDLWTGC